MRSLHLCKINPQQGIGMKSYRSVLRSQSVIVRVVPIINKGDDLPSPGLAIWHGRAAGYAHIRQSALPAVVLQQPALFKTLRLQQHRDMVSQLAEHPRCNEQRMCCALFTWHAKHAALDCHHQVTEEVAQKSMLHSMQAMSFLEPWEACAPPCTPPCRVALLHFLMLARNLCLSF